MQAKRKTKKELIKLLEKYKLPKNIIKHSLLVNKVANYLAKKLKRKGIDIDLDLVNCASLLHDIGKYEQICYGKPHAEVAAQILKKEGMPKAARIAKKHALQNFDKLRTWEEKIVYYADKRVMHDKIVSLDERLKDLANRYPKDKKVITTIGEKIKRLEKRIFKIIGEDPYDLNKKIR